MHHPHNDRWMLMAMWLGELCHISPLAVFVSTKYQKKNMLQKTHWYLAIMQ